MKRTLNAGTNRILVQIESGFKSRHVERVHAEPWTANPKPLEAKPNDDMILSKGFLKQIQAIWPWSIIHRSIARVEAASEAGVAETSKGPTANPRPVLHLCKTSTQHLPSPWLFFVCDFCCCRARACIIHLSRLASCCSGCDRRSIVPSLPLQFPLFSSVALPTRYLH